MAQASSQPFLFTGWLPDDAALSESLPVICCPSQKLKHVRCAFASGAGICEEEEEEKEEEGGEGEHLKNVP